MDFSRYALDLPEPSVIRALLERAIDMNRERDTMIAKFRDALDGKNPIAAPSSMQFKVVTKHGYHLRAAVNEKTARYRRIPEIKVVPFSIFKTAQREADQTEKSINIMLDTIDQTSGGNVWANVVHDVHVLDAGVERWERAPAAWWPELVMGADGKDNLMRLFEDEKTYEAEKAKYLKKMGPCIRRVYVPLERFYPIVEGGTIVECFEVEERSLRSVLGNKSFDTAQLSGYNLGNDGGMSTKVVVLHYSNQQFHAYYALGPSNAGNSTWPRLAQTNTLATGTPVLLHHYRHGLGKVIYNYVPGRGGGWLGGNNNIDGVMKALLELNQDADEVNSQIMTYIRNVLWPTRVAYFDPDKRGGDEAPPKPPVIPEGSTISMFVGEKIENMVQSLPEFGLAQWAYGNIKERIGELAGASVLYGDRAPGVNTGYHQQLQISQAEHLDAMLEASLVRGAINGVLIALEHIRQTGEKCYVAYHSKDNKGRMAGEWLAIDPAKLDPMPQLAAKVRDPRPTDLLTGIQAALQATQIRPGHNTPLLPDDYVLENFLGIESPDDMERMKLEQSYRNKLLQGDVLNQVLGVRLGMALAQREGAQLTPDVAAGASPAFQQAVQQMNQSGEAASLGGVAPANAMAMIEGQAQAGTPPAPPPGPPSGAVPQQSGMAGALAGTGGGVPAGNPQPAQVSARVQELLRQVQG